jgi:RNA polymerase sigma factor (sigma-70 family)
MRALFEKFLAGDNAAFAELYREMNPRLSAYCHKLAPGKADDLMQELWERVIAMRSPSSARGGGRGVESPQAFLFRMLKNLAIDEHRKGKNEIAMNGEMADGPHATHPSHISSIEESSDIECIIIEALEKLSQDDREVLVLNIYSGYNFGEIAKMVGATPEAVWQRASRARVKLRKIVIEDAKRMGVALPKINSDAKATQKKETII